MARSQESLTIAVYPELLTDPQRFNDLCMLAVLCGIRDFEHAYRRLVAEAENAPQRQLLLDRIYRRLLLGEPLVP